MKTLQNFIVPILLALILLSVSLARAGGTAPETDVLRFTNTASSNPFNMLQAVALNAAEATRTVTLPLKRRWPSLKVFVFYTYSAATAVTMTLQCSMDGTNYGFTQSGSVAAGVRTLSRLTDSKTTGAANQNYSWTVGVKGCESVKLVFAGTGAGAGDLVNVQVSAITGN